MNAADKRLGEPLLPDGQQANLDFMLNALMSVSLRESTTLLQLKDMVMHTFLCTELFGNWSGNRTADLDSAQHQRFH